MNNKNGNKGSFLIALFKLSIFFVVLFIISELLFIIIPHGFNNQRYDEFTTLLIRISQRLGMNEQARWLFVFKIDRAIEQTGFCANLNIDLHKHIAEEIDYENIRMDNNPCLAVAAAKLSWQALYQNETLFARNLMQAAVCLAPDWSVFYLELAAIDSQLGDNSRVEDDLRQCESKKTAKDHCLEEKNKLRINGQAYSFKPKQYRQSIIQEICK